MSIGAFIARSTAKTAAIFQIPRRGKIAKDYYADIIIFDPENFQDKADYRDAFQLAEGLEYSIINGELAVEKGAYNEGRPGRVLSK